MSGTAISQIIAIIISPLLTRVYSPADFGIFALYISTLTLLTIIATGKYELAINLPKKNQNAHLLVFLTVCLSLSFSLLLMIIIFFFHKDIILLLDKPDLNQWIYLLPVSVILSGIYISMQLWLSRQKRFQEMSTVVIIQSSITSLLSLFLGYIGMGYGGLILSSLAASILSTTILLKKIISNIPLFSLLKMLSLAKKYIKFPKYSIIADFFNNFSHQLPIFFLPFLFELSTGGLYFLAQRIIKVPLGLLSNSIGEVFRQAASQEYIRHQNCRIIYLQTLRKLIMISILPFIMLFLFAPFLFGFVFGEDWKIAGEYVQILAPMFFMQFISSPLSSMYHITQRQDKDLLFQTQFFFFTLLVFMLSYIFDWNIYLTLSVLSGYYSIVYALNVFITYRFSYNSIKKDDT